jgi:orotidine-5'-phosphate decarboxylase
MSPIPIIALDVPDAGAALALVEELGDACRFYKIGSELFTACGPSIVRQVRSTGADVFLDLKFHDIPNTVSGAVRRAAAMGARLVTVHAAGGVAMLRAAVAAAGDSADCAVLAVTVLTSLDGPEIATAWGRDPRNLQLVDEVIRLGSLARDAGVAGVVCSAREARAVKDGLGPSFAVLIPGIRMMGGATHDQSRTSTPAEAAATGADYVVVGRAVTAAPDRGRAMRELQLQLQSEPRPGSLA